MARDYARLMTRIWHNEDFLALNSGAQRLYMLALSQDTVNLCGVTTWTARRWARLAANTSPGTIAKDLRELAGAGFVVTDDDTEELWITAWFRYDDVLRTPNMVKAMSRDFVVIHSGRIRDAITAWFRGAYPDGFRRGMAGAFPLAFPDGNLDGIADGFLHGIGEPIGLPIADGIGEPIGESIGEPIGDGIPRASTWARAPTRQPQPQPQPQPAACNLQPQPSTTEVKNTPAPLAENDTGPDSPADDVRPPPLAALAENFDPDDQTLLDNPETETSVPPKVPQPVAEARKPLASTMTADPPSIRNTGPPGTEGFDAFWAKYPRKADKAKAERLFAKTGQPEMVFAGLERWCAYWAGSTIDLEFIPYPTTWLGNKRWKDTPPPVRLPTGVAEMTNGRTVIDEWAAGYGMPPL